MTPLMLISLLLASPALSAERPPAGAPDLTFDRTVTGQPIGLPQGPVVVAVRISEFKAGSRLPIHKQPYQRYAYVLRGRLRVTYVDEKVVKEFGPGDLIVEGVDQWHYVEPMGSEDVRLVVIDQTPPGKPNVVIQPSRR